MTYAEWEDLTFHGIAPVPPKPRSALTLPTFAYLLDEHFREVVHPHVTAMQRKYPALFTGEFSLTPRLKERYPSERLTDIEMAARWHEEMMRPSLLQKLPRDITWKNGTTVTIPFRNNRHD